MASPRSKSPVPDEDVEEEEVPQWRKVTAAVAENKWFTGVMTGFTIYALFGDDIRLAATGPGADPVFYSISCIALFLFLSELVMNSVAKKEYIFGFYFWLDLMATLSLIPDIGWIWDAITGTDSSNTDATGAIKAGRASRAGTRAGRIVRIVRLVRLIRIVKLYKHVKEGAGGDAAEKAREQLEKDPSQVGKRLSDMTTRRVIVLVLCMIILIPVFDLNTYKDTEAEEKVQSYGITALHRDYFLMPTSAYESAANQFATQGTIMFLMVNNTDQRALLNRLPGFDKSALRTLAQIEDEFRSTEVHLAATSDSDVCLTSNGDQIPSTLNEGVCKSFAYFSIKHNTLLEAILNILKTLFVMVILAAGAFFFTRDAERLVIGPIERMVGIVQQLAKDPLAAVSTHTLHDEEAEVSFETNLLEKTMIKIGGLLQIGFGEAGSEIIGNNLSSGDLNAMIDGSMMTGIFGFCDIRQFTDTTECLQEEVMRFVNQVGGIVHTCCHVYGGAINKNIGDAFLVVWRLPQAARPDIAEEKVADAIDTPSRLSHSYSVAAIDIEMVAHETKVDVLAHLTDSEDEADAGKDGKGGGKGEAKTPDSSPEAIITQSTDNALAAFITMYIDIENSNRAGKLHLWQQHEKVKARFPGGYSVRLGYGLHIGWAIEGAIGSQFKIDASYLSPNVNMAARLEAATKQFRTPILLSGTFYDALSDPAKAMCRCIDCVTVKGSAEPMKLYTVDITHVPGKAGGYPSTETIVGKPPRGERVADFTHPKIRKIQKTLHEDFYATWQSAVDGYLSGDWAKCKEQLTRGLVLKPGDGPTKTLWEVIEKHDFVAPAGWEGFRELTEK